jgi:transcriptional regulator with XRE-family HTH domain
MGEKLKEMIESEITAKGIPASELARLIGIAGASLWNHSHGISEPTIRIYAKYATYFGMPLRQLISQDAPGDTEAILQESKEWARLDVDEAKLLSTYRKIKRYGRQHADVALDYVQFLLDRTEEKELPKIKEKKDTKKNQKTLQYENKENKKQVG